MNCVVNKNVAVVPVWNKCIQKYYDIGSEWLQERRKSRI